MTHISGPNSPRLSRELAEDAERIEQLLPNLLGSRVLVRVESVDERLPLVIIQVEGPPRDTVAAHNRRQYWL